MKLYDKPGGMELVLFTSAATCSTMITTPAQIWPFFKSVIRDFGRPYRWGWAHELEGGVGNE